MNYYAVRVITAKGPRLLLVTAWDEKSAENRARYLAEDYGGNVTIGWSVRCHNLTVH